MPASGNPVTNNTSLAKTAASESTSKGMPVSQVSPTFVVTFSIFVQIQAPTANAAPNQPKARAAATTQYDQSAVGRSPTATEAQGLRHLNSAAAASSPTTASQSQVQVNGQSKQATRTLGELMRLL